MAEAVDEPGRCHDVAIVGYGPTGAILARLLGQAGLSVLVVDREAAAYPLPRAIHFDCEVMRVFQSAGLRDRVSAIARPGTEGMHFVNRAGETLLIRMPWPSQIAWIHASAGSCRLPAFFSCHSILRKTAKTLVPR